MKRIALIPAFEPDMKIIGTLSGLCEAGYETVVVNDGSAPEYDILFRQAEKYGTVLGYADNKGKGMAIKTGLAYIKSHYTGHYIAVTVDADGQHKVEDVIRCCRSAEDEPDTLILGSRQEEKHEVKVPWRSRFGNALTKYVFRLRAGVMLHDTQTGLRAFSDSLIDTMLEIPGERYEYEMNMLLYFADKKISMKEVRIAKIYINENETSHFDPVRDSIRIYSCIFKVPAIVSFGLSSLIGFVTDYSAYAVLVTLAGALALPTAAAITISNIAARVLSASVNYSINRRYVFKSNENMVSSAAKYAALACCILAGNTVLLNFMVETLGINRYYAKLVTEITFFTFSWIVQKWVIFKGKAEQKTAILQNTKQMKGIME